jgi:hypothetical protein
MDFPFFIRPRRRRDEATSPQPKPPVTTGAPRTGDQLQAAIELGAAEYDSERAEARFFHRPRTNPPVR